MGKLSNKELQKLLTCIRKDPRVIVPPTPGFDSGVHLLDEDKCLVISTDPCINVDARWFGWLLIHYAASDVALFGAEPRFCTLNLLSPPCTKTETIRKIMKEACSAANDINVSIVTGHTGSYQGLSTMIGVCTAYGLTEKERLITPADAKAEDYIICVKPIGLETVVNLCLVNKPVARRLFGSLRAKEIESLVQLQSCVREALLLAKIKGVHAMHDATEGGLTACLNEMTEASKIGFEATFECIHFADEMHTIKAFFKLSDNELMSTSSTGTFIAACDSKAKAEVLEALRHCGVDANVIGKFTEEKKRVLIEDGRRKAFPNSADDPYERILSGKV